jgi:DNA repair protein RecO (recombination protein O)
MPIKSTISYFVENMPREISHLAIILKKQPLNEADELVTIFSKEAGKLRALAKSAKLAKSKLQHGLQVLFLIKLTLAGSSLPKIIGAEVLETFSHIRSSLEASKTAFFALEILLKFTADEHRNEKLFNLYLDFFRFLDKTAEDPDKLNFGLAKFKIDFLTAVGFSVSADRPKDFIGNISFSNSRGGFEFGQGAPDGQSASEQAFNRFKELRALNFSALEDYRIPSVGDIEYLQRILSGFLEYQLEREIKSERFLNG